MATATTIYSGADAALRDLRKLIKLAPNQFEKALYQEAQIELKEIKRVTPVDTGALRASEGVTLPKREGRRVWVEIFAGGPSAPYAFIVHEDLEAFHPHGQAKFIEGPLNESAPHMAERIAKRIDLNNAPDAS